MEKILSIATFIWLSLFSFTGNAQLNSANSITELVILHTNDLHTHFAGTDDKGNACNTEEGCQGGYGQIADIIAKTKEKAPNVLVLDAGDRLQGSLVYSINKWEGARDFEKFLNFDIVTLGNHEYDEGCDELAKYIRNSNYKVVAANIEIKKDGALQKNDFVPYEIKKYGNIKVGIIGLASDLISKKSSSCDNLAFSIPQKAAQEAIDKLKKQGVNFIIVLSHLGIEKDIELGKSLKGANLIVGGHSHKYIGDGSLIGPYPMLLTSPDGKPTLMVTTNGLARYLGELIINFDSKGEVLSVSGRPLLLGNAGGQKNISELVKENYKDIQTMLNTPIFVNQVNAKDGFDACRHGACLTASLMAQSMKEYDKSKGVDLALINGGTVRNAIPLGEVTRGDLLAAMPFGDILVYKEMPGSAIVEALKQGISDPDGIGARMLHAAGIKYWHDPNAPTEQRLIKVEIVKPDGTTQALDPQKKYVVATTKFLSEGGDKHFAIQNSKTIKESNIKIMDIIEEKFKPNKKFNTPPVQDINIINTIEK